MARVAGRAPPRRQSRAHEQFLQLWRGASRCRECPRMRHRSALLGPQCGNLAARVFFVAEAPGRLGADITRIPMCGDRTGQNFVRLLDRGGWTRSDVFVTNAVLCNPRDARGRNASPSPEEIRKCSQFLRATIDLVQPEFLVSLGSTALKALAIIAPHTAALGRDVGALLPWYGRTLVPLYHPGPRALIHRPLETQLEDFAELRRNVSRTLRSG